MLLQAQRCSARQLVPPRIAERTLLLYCPEQGGWQTGEWLHERQCWVSTAAIDEVLEPTMWTEAPDVLAS